MELANYVRFGSCLANSPQTQLPCSTGPSILEQKLPPVLANSVTCRGVHKEPSPQSSDRT